MADITVTEHLLLHQKRTPQATGQFTGLLYDLILSGKSISRRIAKAGLLDILGGTGEVNVQGENVQKMDSIANRIILYRMERCGALCAMENYPGFPKGIKGYELADLFDAHLAGLAVDRPAASVESVTGSAGHFVVRAGGAEHHCKTVIVCSGAHHKPLGLENEDRLRGHGVSYCAICDGNFFRNQTVAVVGGGNSALEESLYLAKIVGKLYLIHRRDEFRGHKIYQDKLAAYGDKIEIMEPAVDMGNAKT